ncbi:response regulator transcription factor [Streptomyces sp. NBC_00510]
MFPTVLVVDDHAGFRAAVRGLLEAEDFEVVGEAADATEAVARTQLLKPYLVLLDIRLPGEDGITVAARLAELADPPLVVLVSSRDAAAYGPRLRDAKALGFPASASRLAPSLVNDRTDVLPTAPDGRQRMPASARA